MRFSRPNVIELQIHIRFEESITKFVELFSCENALAPKSKMKTKAKFFIFGLQPL